MTDWLPGEPTLKRREMRMFKVECACPVTGCNGTLEFNGMRWCTNPYGNHHTCSVCKASFAISDKSYPALEYEPVDDPR